MTSRNYIVYKHTSPSNKSYIGITSQSPERRWRKNGSGYKDNVYFWKAIQKYGWENFKHEILFANLAKEDAEKKEIEMIAYYKSNNDNFGYNLGSGGESGSKGYRFTDEQKARMSESRKGEKNGMYGKHHSEEAKRKNSIAHMKENLSSETIYKMSIAKKGKQRNRESIEKQIDKIAKKVFCVETSTVYKSTKEAGAINNLDSSCIAKVCRGERKTAGGLHWAYIDDMPNSNISVSLCNEKEAV